MFFIRARRKTKKKRRTKRNLNCTQNKLLTSLIFCNLYHKLCIVHLRETEINIQSTFHMKKKTKQKEEVRTAERREKRLTVSATQSRRFLSVTQPRVRRDGRRDIKAAIARPNNGDGNSLSEVESGCASAGTGGGGGGSARPGAPAWYRSGERSNATASRSIVSHRRGSAEFQGSVRRPVRYRHLADTE